jgi:biuret amidohydrolase
VTVVARTRPYPWPFDQRLQGSCIALVLAGWDASWRRRAIGDGTAVEAACASLAKAVDAVGGVVLTVTHGAAEPLAPPIASRAVGAAGLDAFYGGPLEPVLRGLGRTHLVLAGHGLEGPVHSTMRSANDRGFECLLVADAASTLTVDCVDAASSMVCMSGGIFGAVGDTDAVLDALAPLVPGGSS